MSEQVKVDDLEVFRLFRVALLKFGQAAANSMSNADGEIARVHSWLESDQATHWQAQVRKRAEAVTKAREAVRQKKLYLDSSGRPPSAVEEEKMLARCLAAAEQAHQKVEAVRRWLPRLEKEADLYRGGVVRLGEMITGDIPKAVALLDRLAMDLEQYLRIETPTGSAGGAGESSGFEAAGAGGGSTTLMGAPVLAGPGAGPGAEPATKLEEPAAAAPATATGDGNSGDAKGAAAVAQGKEGSHVTHGQ